MTVGKHMKNLRRKDVIDMRKGFTLVEMLIVVITVPLLFVLLDGLFTTLLADIPRSHRIAQESITLQHALEQIQQDLDNAQGLPESFEGLTTNDEQFLIERPDGVFSYQQKNDRIVRRQLTGIKQDNTGDEKAWSLPNTQVTWTVWRRHFVLASRCPKRHRLTLCTLPLPQSTV